MGRNRKEQLSEEVHLQPQVVQDQKRHPFRTYLRHRQFKIKMRMFLIITGGIFTLSHIDLIISSFLAFSLVTYPSPCCVTMLLMNPFFVLKL